MIYYGAKQLADSERTLRKNTMPVRRMPGQVPHVTRPRGAAPAEQAGARV
jgi:hypothetical protein